MSSYSLDVQAAITNLESFYNGLPRSGANPGGFDADGHRVNFIPCLRDVATVSRAAGSVVVAAAAEASQAAGSAAGAVAAMSLTQAAAASAIEALNAATDAAAAGAAEFAIAAAADHADAAIAAAAQAAVTAIAAADHAVNAAGSAALAEAWAAQAQGAVNGIRVTADDTAAAPLAGKLQAGAGLSMAVRDAGGGDLRLVIAASPAARRAARAARLLRASL